MSSNQNTLLTKHIALDCEMVGTGHMGETNTLARVTIVNQNGEVLLDKYCKPNEVVKNNNPGSWCEFQC